MTVLLFALQLALGIIVPWWIVKRDLARLQAKQLSRAWTPVSFWMAIVVFGPLAIPFHFTKTRRSFWGFCLGLLWAVGAFIAIGLTATAFGAVLGVE